MADAITLTTPLARAAVTGYTPGSLLIQLLPAPRIVVTILATGSGLGEVFEYPHPAVPSFDTEAEVAALITALNTANLSVRSLWLRVMDRLVADFPARFPGGATVA